MSAPLTAVLDRQPWRDRAPGDAHSPIGMGIRCVAVFVDADDRRSRSCREADVAVRLRTVLPRSPRRWSRLPLRRPAPTPIHPGYGFLSENAEFARAVARRRDLIWVGPTPDVIEAMGDKVAAKRVAIEAGVPTLPVDPRIPTDVGLHRAGERSGTRSSSRPSAGGGGKGMRMVAVARTSSPTAVQSAAQREAKSGFGDEHRVRRALRTAIEPARRDPGPR